MTYDENSINNEIEKLRNENKNIVAELEYFRSIQEDILARKVFEKSKKLFKMWITVGALGIIVAVVVGISSILNTTKENLTKKISQLGIENIQDDLKREGRQQLHQYVDVQKRRISEIAKRETTRLINEMLPIKVKSGSSDQSEPEVKLPQSLDLKNKMPPLEDQGQLASNVAVSVTSAMEFHNSIQNKHVNLSRLYLYYWARHERGQKGYTDIYLADAIKVARNRGVIEEMYWPYVFDRANEEPSDEAVRQRHYKIKNEHQLFSLREVKRALHESGPVVSSIVIFDSIFNDSKNGKVIMPLESDPRLGDLTVCIVGYNDDTKHLRFMNVWGPGWGEGGYGYLPYEYFERFAKETWVFSGIE